MEIFQCIKWGRIENEQLGLTPDISNLLKNFHANGIMKSHGKSGTVGKRVRMMK